MSNAKLFSVKLFSPHSRNTKESVDSEDLRRVFEKLPDHEQEILKASIDKVDSALRRARKERYGDERTGFGEVAGLELMASLGVWLSELDRIRPEEYKAIVKSS